MNRPARLMVLTLTAILSASAGSQAGSIWAKARHRKRPLYADDTARKIGDSLIIIIDERSVIENETSRDMQKDTSRSAKTSGTLDLADVGGLVGRRIFDFPRLDATATSSTKFGGSANYDSDRSVLDRITVTVEDVIMGDATLDGAVDGADYTAWADNYEKTGMTWGTGDFTGEGDVDGADYTAWADHYEWTVLGSEVPEPCSAVLLVLGTCLPLLRRRR